MGGGVGTGVGPSEHSIGASVEKTEGLATGALREGTVLSVEGVGARVKVDTSECQ